MNSPRKSFAPRRYMAAAVIAASMAVATGGCADDSASAASVANSDTPTAVIAHRGGALLRPENTLPAFRHAAELGAEYIEFDMLMTADDQIAVYHDGTINQQFCTPAAESGVIPGPVHELTLAQMQRFDCGTGARASYAGAKFVPAPGAHIPTLDEVLAAMRGNDARLFVETKIPKDAGIDPVRFAELLDEAVRRHGLEERVILQSFDFRTIDALHGINPRIRTCLLGVPDRTDDYLSLLRKHRATCIVLSDDQIDHTGVRELQEAGVLVFSGVVDTPQDWEKATGLGMDAIFTNDPQGAIEFLENAGLRP